MTVEALAQILHTQKTEISEKAADKIIAQKLEVYASAGKIKLVEKLIPSVEVFARYFQSGDISEFQNSLLSVATQRLEQGHSVQEVGQAINLLLDECNNAVQLKLDTLTQPTRESYARRLKSIQMLCHVAITTAGSRQRTK